MSRSSETFGRDLRTLVEGAGNLRVDAFGDEAAVVEVAVGQFFRDHPVVRQAAAVDRHLNGDLSRAEAARLAGMEREAFAALVDELVESAERERVAEATG
jgi:predicted HTH domain antitoxin